MVPSLRLQEHRHGRAPQRPCLGMRPMEPSTPYTHSAGGWRKAQGPLADITGHVPAGVIMTSSGGCPQGDPRAAYVLSLLAARDGLGAHTLHPSSANRLSAETADPWRQGAAQLQSGVGRAQTGSSCPSSPLGPSAPHGSLGAELPAALAASVLGRIPACCTSLGGGRGPACQVYCSPGVMLGGALAAGARYHSSLADRWEREVKAVARSQLHPTDAGQRYRSGRGLSTGEFLEQARRVGALGRVPAAWHSAHCPNTHTHRPQDGG